MAKWEAIKASAIKQASLSFRNGDGNSFFPGELLLDAIEKRQNIYASIDAANLEIRKRIQMWDIRVATKLRDVFPRAFPPAIRSGPLSAFMDDRGDWVLERS